MTKTKLKKKSLVAQIKASAEKPIERKGDETVKPDRLIPTGSTLFDLALSDTIEGGFAMGKMSNLIGDSDTGKTVIGLSVLAEACRLERFDAYDLVYNDVEAALAFDLKKTFGKKLAERIEIMDSSETVQDFQADVLGRLKKGKPFIYILDSFDALTSEEEIAKIEARIEAKRKGKQIAGSYGMEKAKSVGQTLRMVTRKVEKSDSALIIISQTRDNINPMSFVKKTRSGGKALKFYATQEIWLAMGGKVKRKDRDIGVTALVRVERTKLTGKKRRVKFCIYYDYGIDDTESCIDFMVDEGGWEMNKQTIAATGLQISGTKLSLIKQIEEKELEGKLKMEVAKLWQKIEDSIKLNRKPKYE